MPKSHGNAHPPNHRLKFPPATLHASMLLSMFEHQSAPLSVPFGYWRRPRHPLLVFLGWTPPNSSAELLELDH
jgi:hypothetical protein